MAKNFPITSIDFFKGQVVIQLPLTLSPKRIFKDLPIVYERKSDRFKGDALLYPAILTRLEQMGIPFTDHIANWPELDLTEKIYPVLRENQRNAVEAWMADRKGIIVMPTGSGKTHVAINIMARLRTPTLIVVPRRILLAQWQEAIASRLGYRAGILGDGKSEIKEITISSYQSAQNHIQRIGKRFKLMVFDECHHLPGKSRQLSAIASVAPYRLGLTATPKRLDRHDTLYPKLIGSIVYQQTIQQLKGSVLAEFRTHLIQVKLSVYLQEKYNNAGKTIRQILMKYLEKVPDGSTSDKWRKLLPSIPNESDKKEIVNALKLRQDIENRAPEKLDAIEQILKNHPNHSTIIFAGSNNMARDISLRFFIPSILFGISRDEQFDILTGFSKGYFQAIVANQILDEGIDLTNASVGIVVGGSGSPRQMKQRLGRLLRKSGNKKSILYEIVCKDTSETRRSLRRTLENAEE